MYEGLLAETVTITGHGDDEIGAYLARPLGAGPFPGVIVIHHAPGWDEGSKEIARKFAYHGYIAISPNLYHRFGPDLAPGRRGRGGARRRLGAPPSSSSVTPAVRCTYLRGLPVSNGKVGTIGYCSGGRQSFLAACELPIDAAVDCYGAFVMRRFAARASLSGWRRSSTARRRSRARSSGSSGSRTRTRRRPRSRRSTRSSTRLGKEHEFHTFDDAGSRRSSRSIGPSYRVAAAVEGWRLVFDFYGRHLSKEIGQCARTSLRRPA